ncbi:hypothetical protein FRACYDRAFT_213103 [Fragilariopsis cylindrus CCMP1102]|uniref:Uncharacterized protein n=1 Tax=Fragilariopsis cylindrus CCMP1102 TaxID=635003 RepID=A0A1E7ENK5_9STRA|nr:hypothetical protein FRACYDRAFT_213103 [Fragilariopsis cylindrus CCMP1102]|eukprot:OEU07530.1 hypothetical protein FRACYDRAFT_213103 [Fragilariopsis cylindrus CCMP1102]
MTLPENVFDVTVICCTDDHQAEFWMTKLKHGAHGASSSSSSSSSVFPLVIAVSEDWSDPSGAGNGLGTLYAWKKACDYAKSSSTVTDNPDLESLLQQGTISAALYHTAGKGTRLAPLPASENNNKPGVKLPFPKHLTVLEAVVRQTGIYASSRKGRLSVFWGDQVFLPPAVENFRYESTHHIDIMCTLLGDTAPTAEEWLEQGLDKYGVIAVMKESGEGGKVAEAAQVEKVSHETATSMLQTLGTIAQVGPSLGSFSLSAAMLEGLCDEYSIELTEKVAKLDTDPHFWMPLTLPEESYVSLMLQKGVDEQTSMSHHLRMQVFSARFQRANEDTSKLGLFGAVDVGKDACWWDYGQLPLYSKNSLLLLDDSNPESKLLRKFLGITDSPMTGVFAQSNVMFQHSYAFDCNIADGTIKDSLLSHVTAREVNADGAILVNCVAPKITAGKGSILYNIIGEKEIIAEPGQVMVAVSSDDGKAIGISSRVDIDGGKAWKTEVEGNPMSFEQVWKNNKNTDISKVDLRRKELYTYFTGKVFEMNK